MDSYPKLTAVSYARKSIKVKGVSIEDSINYQQVEIERYARLNNIEIIKSYHDVGYTGRNTKRPELQEMLYDLRHRKVDVLLMYSVDRFGRDLVNNIEQMLEITRHVKKVVFIAQGFSSDVENFKMFFLLLTGMAQEEWKRLMRGLADGRKAKILNRKQYDGRYPLGYVLAKDGKKIVPATQLNTDDISKQQELHIVQFIFYCYLFNFSLRGIAETLNRKFGATRLEKSWSYKSVRYVLVNKIYSGFLYGTLEGKEKYLFQSENIQPIIDPLIHQLILKRLEFEKPGRKCKNYPFILPNYCLCKKCGGALIRKDEYLSCSSCQKEVRACTIGEKLQKEINNLIQKQTSTSINYNKLEKLYEYKLVKNKRKMQELIEAREEIERGGYFTKSMVKELRLINTNEYCTLQEENLSIEQVLKLLKNDQKHLDNYENPLDDDYLLMLPFIILVDFLSSKIEVVFHKQIFNNEDDFNE
ncbi:recombinase family protein [Neobacillus sp. PS3-40]|uniref:recombinase family protein n=1 Tax=Neobacillus sp. PS3-40 TaxID=3070679 RepID=UPI0027DF7F81|nr:recombinase family protein [Neobacillus sp. PS3-40]WML46172.1 recombinase family protein [Neobacillus sp. PS3-40]